MPEFPFVSGGVVRTVGAVAGASSLATTVTTGAVNTKGTAVELVAATEFDASWVMVQLSGSNAANNFMIDIMIGAATEQVIIPDLYARLGGTGGAWPMYLFPIFIPKGSRLSTRAQSGGSGVICKIALTLIAGTLLSGGGAPSMVAAYGDVASTLGTNVDPGAVADTDSAWVELTAATTRAHNWLVVAGRLGDASLTAATSWRLSIGIGAATEEVLVPNLHSSGVSTEGVPRQVVWHLPVFIPISSRLTARVRSSVTTDGDRDVWLKLYGAG